MTGIPEARPFGLRPQRCGLLSDAQTGALVGVQEAPELRIVVARKALEPAPDVAPQHGDAADHRGVSGHASDRSGKIIERRGSHEILSESGPNPSCPDALLTGTLRTQVNEPDGLQIAALGDPAEHA